MSYQPTTLKSTYSMWRLFRNCRKKFDFRYQQELIPIRVNTNQLFGSLIHKCLEKWHGGGNKIDIKTIIYAAFPNHAFSFDKPQKKLWHYARAMMTVYIEKYGRDSFEVIALEKTFSGPIVNPDTGCHSRTFHLEGKVDGIVKQEGKYYLLEHKTASKIDESYLARLWTDFQIIIYTMYIEEELGIKIEGIIYNMLGKCKLKQGEGETEQEYIARKTELQAEADRKAVEKGKVAKTSTAKRKMPETDEVYQERLLSWYRDNSDDVFVRQEIVISPDQFEKLQDELWELTQSYLDAKKRGCFYQNPSQCYTWNTVCEYFPICSSGNPDIVISNEFIKMEAYIELSDKTPDVPF